MGLPVLIKKSGTYCVLFLNETVLNRLDLYTLIHQGPLIDGRTSLSCSTKNLVVLPIINGSSTNRCCLGVLCFKKLNQPRLLSFVVNFHYFCRSFYKNWYLLKKSIDGVSGFEPRGLGIWFRDINLWRCLFVFSVVVLRCVLNQHSREKDAKVDWEISCLVIVNFPRLWDFCLPTLLCL